MNISILQNHGQTINFDYHIDGTCVTQMCKY